MRILLVTHYYPEHRGGVEIVAGALARRLAGHGDIRVTWLASGTPPAENVPGVRRVPVRAWNVTEDWLGFPYPLWSPRALADLSRHIRDADLVHLHDCLYAGNVAGYLWARHHHKPIVVTQHIGPVPYSNPLLRAALGAANQTLGRLVLGGCDQAVFVSPRVQRYFEDFVRFRRPPVHLANGVDTAVFFPVDPQARRALRARLGIGPGDVVRLFVGRFVEKKGLPFLRRLASERPRDHWVFVGWGPDDPSAWNLPNVRVAGALPQPSIADHYRAADVLVLPSVGEGFPLVVQEAMACGLPAMVSAETLDGAPDARAAITGVPLDDRAWAEAIARFDAEPDPISRRDRVATFARRWDWDAVANQYHGVFHTLGV
jgi:glycosyltransferase involved in cell wall biosynthesis